ncbi:MAG TPA: hypothetical protein VK001_00085 [Geminicoccaceae bacterium]|nr:hypothetical protein [Geminicoccaceae bacterium]
MGRLKQDSLVYEQPEEREERYDDPDYKCEHCGDQVAEPGLCYVCHRDAEIEWMREREKRP